MIAVKEALKAIDQHVSVGSVITIPVQNALDCVLASDVKSPINMPPFRQSAMDGYAICSNGSATFKLIDEVKAGDGHEPHLKEGEAIRIFTGAPVPSTADTVVRQEDTRAETTTLIVESLPAKGANIRPHAEQIAEGEIALKQGQFLNAAAIGYLSTLGITTVNVYRKPTVSILVTGNELIAPGRELQYGQIYESNAPMLVAALNKLGITEVDVQYVHDDYESTKSQLEQILHTSDLTLCSGGISVGDYDFVGNALRELGVQEIFYKVKQKPGKPLFFGKLESKVVFALPGNPASALTSFYVYVSKAIALFMGQRNEHLVSETKRITQDFVKKGDRAQFLKAAVCGDEVAVLDSQSSAMLNSFALANALVYVPAEVEHYRKGDKVKCIMLP